MTQVVEARYSKYVTVMWPVLDSEVPGAHCTGVFLGESDALDTLNITKQMVIDALTPFHFDAPGSVPVTTYEVFGLDHPVIVGTLDKRINTFRRPLLNAINDEVAVVPADTYPFRGHVTLGAAPRYTDFQRSFYLGAPQLWWGDRRYVL